MPLTLVRRALAAPTFVLPALLVLLAACSAERTLAPELRPDSPRYQVGAAARPTLIITEIFADPNGGIADATAEWFEVYNPGSEAVGLAGWTLLSNNTSETHVVPATSTATVPAGGYAVLGNNAALATNGGVAVAYQYPGTFQLANSNAAERIELRDASGAVVDLVTLGRSAVGSRTFMLRLPTCENAVVNANANWVTASSTAPYEFFAANYGTPGAANDATGSLGACVGGDGVVGALDVLTVVGPATVNNGAAVTLTPAATDADGDAVTSDSVAWSDGGSPLVTVTPTGPRTATVTGDGIGSPVTITASLTVGGVSRMATTTVTVGQAPIPGGTARIAFSGFNSAPLPVDFEDQLFARMFDAGNIELTSMAVTWRTTTPELASIDPATGVVRGIAPGRALFVARTADGFEASAFVDITVAVAATTPVYGNHLEFGRPVDATPEDDFLVQWPQFVSSYNRTRGQPNWIAYNLEATHRGPAERCDCFTHDPSLPADFPRLTTDDYVGSGYSRGHMTMSEDRTAGGAARLTSLDNARTFYFTNIIPQTSANNGGPWLALETHLGALATTQDREVYVIAGGARYQGTLNGAGRIAIPTRTWKVAVVMPRDRGLANVRALGDLEVIAVDMPNTESVPSTKWQDYRVTVDSVEALTGYDVLSLLPDHVEHILESGDRAPTARLTGDTSVVEGEALALDASTSSDPDVGGPLADVLRYRWSVDGQPVAQESASLTRSFVDDGTHTVRLIVIDRFGAADTTSTTVVVRNAAPTVATFAGATLYQGETYQAAGSFTDPGTDGWTATVDYGFGARPLTLTGKTFVLSEPYTVARTFTVRVVVTDDDAGVGTATATVTVRTPIEGVTELSQRVAALAPTRTFDRGELTALRLKLEAAANQLHAGNGAAAANVLNAFVQQLRELTGDGSLTREQTLPLEELAQRVASSAAR